MTCLALCIVILDAGVHLFVRVVAGNTADALIVRVVAFAFRQAVGLEANVGNARLSLHRNFLPCAMTLPAEVGHLLGRKSIQIGR